MNLTAPDAFSQPSKQRSEQDIADEIIRDQAFHQSMRGNWERLWEDSAAVVQPQFVNTFTGREGSSVNQGERRDHQMYDSTAALALPKFVAACSAYLTPEGSTWGQIRALDPAIRRHRPTQEWFDLVTEYRQRYHSAPYANFSGANPEVLGSMGTFGTGVLFSDPLRDPIFGRGIRYRSVHLAEIYLVQNFQGIIYKAYRKFEQTAENAYAKWGDKLPEDVIRDAKDGKKSQNKHWFIHCVRPRLAVDGYDPGSLSPRRFPYASYYVSVTGKKLIAEDGYGRFPYSVSRYVTGPGETYGRGPAILALGTINVLQQQGKAMLKQSRRALDPVILTHDDGVGNGFNLTPGADNPGYVNADGRPLAHVLPSGQIQVSREIINDNRYIVNDAFLVTLFQLLMDHPQKTATEVLQDVQEKGQLVTPTLGRQKSEYLAPMIDRDLDILSFERLLPPPPPYFADAMAEYEVYYDNPLSRAQRAESAAGFMRTVQWAAEWFKISQDPRVFDWINIDQALPDIADINAVPLRWINDEESVRMLREQRAQQQQIATAIEAAPAMAGMAKVMQDGQQ